MTDIEVFINEKPECFGRRRTLQSDDADCLRCQHKNPCFSVVKGVLNAVTRGELPANGYFPSELLGFRQSSNHLCKHYGLDANLEFPIDILKHLHTRVLPLRSPEDVETAREFEDLYEELGASIPPTPNKHEPVVQSAAEAHEVTEVAHVSEVKPTPVTAPSLSAAVPMKLSSMASVAYHFPMPGIRQYIDISNAELANELEKLIIQGFHIASAPSYAAIREKFCAIHIEMNLRQMHGPRFRPTHNLKWKPTTEDEKVESLDRQVIDIHWRAHSADKPASPANHYPTIFNSEPFDLAAAERFAQGKWGASAKVTHLHLTEEMQWEHAIIQSKEIQEKWRVLDRGNVRGTEIKVAGAPQIDQRLRDAIRHANKPQVIGNVPGMVDAWKARKIVGDSPAKICKLVALMTGSKPRDLRAMKRTLKSLDGYLGKSSKCR